jgi:DNA-binding IclR family transcriptional regulator
VAQTGAEGKLARYLLTVPSGEPLRLSATDLSKRLGISRASLYRAFQALEDARLIRREGKSMYVLDPAGLEGVL